MNNEFVILPKFFKLSVSIKLAIRSFISFPDSDNDGAISVRELKDMFATLGYQISRKVLRRFIRMVDVDRNGTLSFNEFVSLLVLVNNALAEGEDRPDIYEADFSNFTPDEIEHFRAIFQAVGRISSLFS